MKGCRGGSLVKHEPQNYWVGESRTGGNLMKDILGEKEWQDHL